MAMIMPASVTSTIATCVQSQNGGMRSHYRAPRRPRPAGGAAEVTAPDPQTLASFYERAYTQHPRGGRAVRPLARARGASARPTT